VAPLPAPTAALDRRACYALLATAPLGRVVATAAALPLVVPVVFALDGDDLLFPVAPGSPLAAATRGTVVALQADAVDASRRSGWSVVVTGFADAVGDTGLVRLRPGVVTGLRLQEQGLSSDALGPQVPHLRVARH